MSNFIKDYVDTLNHEQRASIVEGWKTLTEKGSIGDEPVRNTPKNSWTK